MKVKPLVVCLTETFLDASIQEISLEGYLLISRRDRGDGDDDRQCGGVAIFAMQQHADRMTEMLKSRTAERIWVLVHSDLGHLGREVVTTSSSRRG